MQSALAAQSSLWFSHIFSKAHQRSRSEREQVSYTPQTCLMMMRRKRSRSHKMLWYAMILFKNLQNMFVQMDAKEFPIPCWLIQGTICWYWYQLFPVYQEEREVRFTTPQAQCPDLACAFWVTHCVDVPHKCHRDTSGYCPNSCQLSRCMSLWFFRRCSKTFEGSRRWWNAQRKGSVLMSSAADCCHYLS